MSFSISSKRAHMLIHSTCLQAFANKVSKSLKFLNFYVHRPVHLSLVDCKLLSWSANASLYLSKALINAI